MQVALNTAIQQAMFQVIPLIDQAFCYLYLQVASQTAKILAP